MMCRKLRRFILYSDEEHTASPMGDEQAEIVHKQMMNLLNKLVVKPSPISHRSSNSMITSEPYIAAVVTNFQESRIDPFDYSRPTELTGEIIHNDISKFGHTTNVLIHSFLENNRGTQFTREEIRNALEKHKSTIEVNGMGEQHLQRIRVGKASVNYWIDRLVENGSISKKNSNPVLFWLAR